MAAHREEQLARQLEAALQRAEVSEQRAEKMEQDNQRLRLDLIQANQANAEKDSTIMIQGKELEQVALVLQRDRERVKAEIAIEAARIAMANARVARINAGEEP